MAATHNSDDSIESLDVDLSGGWREVFAALACNPDPDPDTVTAATREDRPRRYNLKHARGVSS